MEIKNETEVSNIEVNTTKTSTNLEFTRPLWFVDIKANGYQAEALIDNGSMINLMTIDLAQKFGCEVEEDDSFIINKFEAKKSAAGLTTMRVQTTPTREDELTFLVVDNNYPKLIIGQPGLEQLEVLCDYKTKKVRIADKWITPKIYRNSAAEIHHIEVTLSSKSDSPSREAYKYKKKPIKKSKKNVRVTKKTEFKEKCCHHKPSRSITVGSNTASRMRRFKMRSTKDICLDTRTPTNGSYYVARTRQSWRKGIC